MHKNGIRSRRNNKVHKLQGDEVGVTPTRHPHSTGTTRKKHQAEHKTRQTPGGKRALTQSPFKCGLFFRLVRWLCMCVCRPLTTLSFLPSPPSHMTLWHNIPKCRLRKQTPSLAQNPPDLPRKPLPGQLGSSLGWGSWSRTPLMLRSRATPKMHCQRFPGCFSSSFMPMPMPKRPASCPFDRCSRHKGQETETRVSRLTRVVVDSG